MPPPEDQVRVSTSEAMSLTGLVSCCRFRAPAGSLSAGRGRGQLARRPCRFTVQAVPWLPPGLLEFGVPVTDGLGLDAELALGEGLALTLGCGLGAATAAGAAAVPSASNAAEPIATAMATARLVRALCVTALRMTAL